ncbi:MAG: hypothetical protein HQL15_06815 [Candidatus Omnitrophica bacterium]|nr:hypothetical protein [Candidatus Omnitrophota bacterium]
MKKSLLALLVITAINSSSIAWCETKVYQISVTIPVTAALNTPQSNLSQSSQQQMAQTQQLVRDNRIAMVTSIVVL